MRRNVFDVRFNTDFDGVIRACAAPGYGRNESWINDEIISLYTDLHELGRAHCVEAWLDGTLVGGLYGVALGAAFFGESMFSRKTDASKIALVHLVYHMKRAGFILLDTQFRTEHLERFGVIEVPREEYQDLLEEALHGEAFFDQEGGATSDSILQLFSQIS